MNLTDHNAIQHWLACAAVLGLQIQRSNPDDGYDGWSIEPGDAPCTIIRGVALSYVKFYQGHPFLILSREKSQTRIRIRFDLFPLRAGEAKQIRRLISISEDNPCTSTYFATVLLCPPRRFEPMASKLSAFQDTILLHRWANARLRHAIDIYEHLLIEFKVPELPDFRLLRNRAKGAPIFTEVA